VQSIAKRLSVDPEKYTKNFDFICDYLREGDLLSLRLYFVNFEVKGSLKRKKRDTGKKEKNESYILIRIPQQHIAETFLNTSELQATDTTEALISGYSYLTFKLKDGINEVSFKNEGVLNWDQLDLITLSDLKNTKNLNINTVEGYPTNVLGANESKAFFFDAGPVKLPVTLFEVPYRLFLSPISRMTPRSQRGDYHLGYVFKNNNSLVQLFYKQEGDAKYWMTLPWENELQYAVQSPNGITKDSPNFKAIAYAPSNDKRDKRLIPEEWHRKDIIEHSLLDFDSESRDIKSSQFKFSALGATTFLHYKNLYPKFKRSFVEWKQDIKNGRDNFVELVQIGVDIRSGKKVLVSEIGERVIHNGKSLWIKRYHLKFLEKDKTYTNENYPFTSSKTLTDGFYFKPSQIQEAPDGKPVDLALNGNLLADSNEVIFPIIPFSEDSTGTIPSSSAQIIKNEYLKTDQANDQQKYSSHLCILFKSHLDNNEFDKYNNLHDALAKDSRYKELLREDTIGQKIAYITPIQIEGTTKNERTSLSTRHYQITSKQLGEFNSNSPVSLNLVYAKITPPQIEGFSADQYQTFRYSDNFLNRSILTKQIGQDKRTLNELDKNLSSFDQTNNKTHFKFIHPEHTDIVVDTDVKHVSALALRATFDNNLTSAIDNLDKISSKYNNNRVYFDSVNSAIESNYAETTSEVITDVFSKNIANIGSLVNPDIEIDGISELEQGVTLQSKTELKYIGKEKTAFTQPRDIFRGMNADILGGVSIKDILKEIIPMDESPVFEVIKAADGAFELYRNYKREYAEIKNQIDSIPEEIRVLKNELLTFKRTEVDIYFQKRLETERYRLFARLDQLIVTPFVKKYEAINVDVPTNIFVGKTLVEIKGVLNSPLGSYSGENLIKSFYDHSATDGFTILKELIEDPELQVKPLAKFRKELDQFLYYLNDDFRNDFIGRIEDEMRIFERELPKVISDQLVEQFDNQISQIQQLKSFIIYVKNTISGYKALKLTDVQIDTLIQTAENILIAEFKDSASEIFNEAFALLGRPGSDIMTFENLFSVFKLEEARILKSYHSFQKSIGLDINRTKEDILQEINGKKEELATSIEKFKDFGKFKLKEIKNRLQRENTALIAAYNSGKGVLKAKEDVEKTIALLKKLQESQKQSFRYLWEIGPDNFRPLRTSVVSFYPTSKTEMTVDVKTDVNYKLSISKPPMYLGTEIQSYNQLSDFRLAFFDVLAIDFESIIFESGTKTSTDLDETFRGAQVYEDNSSELQYEQDHENTITCIHSDLKTPSSSENTVGN